MAKLEGVKTLDMVNGEITKVEYNGEVYERVGTDSPKVGDLGMIIDAWGTLCNGDFYKVTEIRNIGYGTYHHLGEDGIGRVEDKDTMFFRKQEQSKASPKRTIAIAGDVVEMITDDDYGDFKNGSRFTVKEDSEVREYIIDNNGDERYINDFDHLKYRIVEFAEEIDHETPELFAKVNRPNNVPITGDYVEFQDSVAKRYSSFLTVGKKYEVERVNAFGVADITDDNGVPETAEPDETKAIYVKYTQEQAEKKAGVGDKILVVDVKSTGGLYGNGDILTASSSNSVGVFVEESSRGLWNEEFIILNPEQVGEATECEEQPEIKPGDYVINHQRTLGRVDEISSGFYLGEWLYNEEYPEDFPLEMSTINAIERLATPEEIAEYEAYKEKQDEQVTNPETIEEGDLVRVVDSPSALPNGSIFKVTEVNEDGTLFGPSKNKSSTTQYIYAPKHVELIAKAVDVYV